MTKKFITKTEQETLNNMDIVTDVEKNNMPGKGGTTFKIQLDKEWFIGTEQLQVDSRVYTKWWQNILNKITFGLYKPTTFWYKIKESDYVVGIDPYTSDGEGSMGAVWDNKEKKFVILNKNNKR